MKLLLVDPQLAAALRSPTPIYLVGGPVRDGLLGRAFKDWDFACRDAQRVARAAAKRLKARFIVLDDQNLIYRVVVPGPEGTRTLDFAQLQGKSIEEDLRRRDFTVNAMAQVIDSEEIIDPCGGRKDLKAKVIRAVSEEAFRSDPLRLLRAFRFSVQLEFAIDSKTLLWIRRHARLLGYPPAPKASGSPVVARERVREELLRLFSQPTAGSGVRAMDEAGLLEVILPDMEPCRRTAISFYGRGGVMKHSLETVEQLDWILTSLEESSSKGRPAYFENSEVRQHLQAYLAAPLGAFPRSAWMKFAGFVHDIGKPATAKRIGGRLRFFGHEDVGADIVRGLGEGLRLSRQENHALSSWVRHHMRLGNLAAASGVSDKAVARYFRDLSDEGLGMILVSLADHYSYLGRRLWGKGRDRVEITAARMLESFVVQREKLLPKKLVNGHQLMKKFRLKPGPMIGTLLEHLADAQAEGVVKTSKDAFAFAKKFLLKHVGKRRP